MEYIKVHQQEGSNIDKILISDWLLWIGAIFTSTGTEVGWISVLYQRGLILAKHNGPHNQRAIARDGEVTQLYSWQLLLKACRLGNSQYSDSKGVLWNEQVDTTLDWLKSYTEQNPQNSISINHASMQNAWMCWVKLEQYMSLPARDLFLQSISRLEESNSTKQCNTQVMQPVCIRKLYNRAGAQYEPPRGAAFCSHNFPSTAGQPGPGRDSPDGPRFCLF